jgi:hypothetical protein
MWSLAFTRRATKTTILLKKGFLTGFVSEVIYGVSLVVSRFSSSILHHYLYIGTSSRHQ